MNHNYRYSHAVLFALTALTFFAIPHLIDDFLFGVPVEFGLTNLGAQILSGWFAVILVLTFVLVSRGRRMGYYVSFSLGAFLALAVILRHIPGMVQPGPYWSGWFSEVLIYGVGVSGIVLLVFSLVAISRNQHHEV